MAENEILSFWTWEAGNAHESRAASGRMGESALTGNDVVAGATFGGNFYAEIDPVNGDILDRYGFQTNFAPLGDENTLGIVAPFYVDSTEAFDDPVTFFEVLEDETASSRRVVLLTDEGVQLQDNDGDVIAGSAVGKFPLDTVVPIYGYFDKVAQRDVVWLYLSGAWDKIIDVSGWGDYNNHARLALGSGTSKGLPTVGTPFRVGPGAVIRNPTSKGIGSIAGFYKAANGDGAGDNEFTLGAGASPHPDFLNVDDAADAQDGDTTWDGGDAAGERSTYDVASAEAGDIPLSVNVVGSCKRTGTGVTATAVGLFDGSTYDMATVEELIVSNGVYSSQFGDRKSHVLMPDGNPWTEAGFNAIEVAAQIDARSANEFRVTQIGAEYCVEGSEPFPPNFLVAFPDRRATPQHMHMIGR